MMTRRRRGEHQGVFAGGKAATAAAGGGGGRQKRQNQDTNIGSGSGQGGEGVPEESSLQGMSVRYCLH